MNAILGGVVTSELRMDRGSAKAVSGGEAWPPGITARCCTTAVPHIGRRRTWSPVGDCNDLSALFPCSATRPGQAEERAPIDAEPDVGRARVAIAEPEDGTPVRAACPTIDRANRGRSGRELVGQAERPEDPLAERLQQDPGADRPRVTNALEDLDLVAIARQQERRRRAAGAAPDHPDAHRLSDLGNSSSSVSRPGGGRSRR